MSESVASEVVSAMVGGMFSASALYPLEVLKTRMQAETKVSAKDGEYCCSVFALLLCVERVESVGSCKICAHHMSHNPPILLSEHNNHIILYNAEDKSKVLPNAQEGKEVSSDDDDTPTTSNNSTTTTDQFAAQQSSAEQQLQIKTNRTKEYQEAASEGMSSYATLMYKYEGGISPFYSGVVTSAVQSATEKALYFFAYTFLKNGYVVLLLYCCFIVCCLFLLHECVYYLIVIRVPSYGLHFTILYSTNLTLLPLLITKQICWHHGQFQHWYIIQSHPRMLR